jgi:hypothetical protein
LVLPDYKEETGKTSKDRGMISQQDFARAGIVMTAHDEARRNGEKHSVALAKAVEFVRQHFPKMRISKTGVKRIFRP